MERQRQVMQQALEAHSEPSATESSELQRKEGETIKLQWATSSSSNSSSGSGIAQASDTTTVATHTTTTAAAIMPVPTLSSLKLKKKPTTITVASVFSEPDPEPTPTPTATTTTSSDSANASTAPAVGSKRFRPDSVATSAQPYVPPSNPSLAYAMVLMLCRCTQRQEAQIIIIIIIIIDGGIVKGKKAIEYQIVLAVCRHSSQDHQQTRARRCILQDERRCVASH
jgi:hypothetical protein